MLRKQNNLTQVQAANAINITERQYQRIETGVSKPTYDNLISIADYYNVSIDYLVGRTGNPNITV
jgi:transcriptional regulator with XRE-family HTH domain